jgi:hypothetical protein
MAAAALGMTNVTGHVAFASGSGLSVFSDPVPATKSSVGFRQVVELRRSGDFALGTPQHSSVALVVIHARDFEGEHVVLRERDNQDGATLLQFSAPSRLEKKLIRATLLVRTDSKPVRLAHGRQGRWIELFPQEFTILADDTPVPEARKVTAFSINDFGLFRIVRAGSPGLLASLQGEPAGFDAFDVDIRISRAGWHFVWPALVLLVAALVSKCAHRTGSLRRK